MNDIEIAITGTSFSGRSGLLQLVKGCPEDSSGVSHAMVPIVFKKAGAPDVTVVNRAVLKRDVSTNKQGVASFVIQVKIPYVRLGESASAAGATPVPRQAVVTKDYISCHMVLALPRNMLADWRDSARQKDTELQLNTALLILNAWAAQYGLVINQAADADTMSGKLYHEYCRFSVPSDNPSTPQKVPALIAGGEPGGRATSFETPITAVLRDPLTDPLMNVFGGVCVEVKPSISPNSDSI